jgi:transcriptional regulator with XRE-family HTH domain
MSYSRNDYDPAKVAEWPSDVRGEIFRQLRADKGYSVEDLAVTCGLTEAEILSIEAGDIPNSDYIPRVAHALGLL